MDKLWHLHKNGALYTSGNKLPTTLTWMNLKSKSFGVREVTNTHSMTQFIYSLETGKTIESVS